MAHGQYNRPPLATTATWSPQPAIYGYGNTATTWPPTTTTNLPSHFIVRFDVGGTKYSTRVSTIMSYTHKNGEETKLSVLINQENEKRLIEQGMEIFIDRNGEIFKHVLDYLRSIDTDGKIVLPQDEFILLKLSAEAKYYKLSALKKLIKDQKSKYRVGDYVKMIYSLNWVANKWKCKHYTFIPNDSIQLYKIVQDNKIQDVLTWSKKREIGELDGKVVSVIDKCMIVEFSTLLAARGGSYKPVCLLHVPESMLKPT